jgi:hypothetical protein
MTVSTSESAKEVMPRLATFTLTASAGIAAFMPLLEALA